MVIQKYKIYVILELVFESTVWPFLQIIDFVRLMLMTQINDTIVPYLINSLSWTIYP